MKALWKVPASLIVLAIGAAVICVLMVPCFLLTLLWLPLAMGGVFEDSDPPAFWPMDLGAALFDWWRDV